MKLLIVAFVFAAVFYAPTTALEASSGLQRDGGHKEVVVPMDNKDHTVEVSEEDMGVDPDVISAEEEERLSGVAMEKQGNFSYCRVLRIWRWRRRFCLYCQTGGSGCRLTIRRP